MIIKEAIDLTWIEQLDEMHKIWDTAQAELESFITPFEILTRENKGDSMNNTCAEIPRPGAMLQREEEMTIKRYKQINDLSYKIKALIDKEIKDLKSNEACMLGEMMQRIINLK